MPRYFIRIAYNGTNYCGWQVQPNGPTVQAELDRVLSLLLQVKVDTLGCGRTDTGVHAADFYAHFDLEAPIDENRQLVYRLNKVIAHDIAVKEIRRVVDSAHARFDAIEREYEYHITKHKDPFKQNMAYFYFGDLNIEAMNTAAAELMKMRDFKAFSKAHTDVKTTLCAVTKAQWVNSESGLVFTITANRFLRNMVRAIVGTLLNVGRGKITIEEFITIANSLDRSEAGDSAPAEGLFLTRVIYPADIFID